eukprot:CAMPEP_0183314186 /NCGR_PEP_ID=MMETSP0160_2-20130417/47688_1 /TAXON_ID=2839 ORGANISM="Odontella Sinensis, Strain Grunow 1884" /NCGR_SAMPLE_ID=MMETSP0160_2 /ASSEMBLY_ACC=CAM_ASM_000250 /LENGTH=63 /DNA_ID=CAMNT_0025479453 /DNA_START=5 /DNA_END=196 /DNA_ORIENTATION=-
MGHRAHRKNQDAQMRARATSGWGQANAVPIVVTTQPQVATSSGHPLDEEREQEGYSMHMRKEA